MNLILKTPSKLYFLNSVHSIECTINGIVIQHDKGILELTRRLVEEDGNTVNLIEDELRLLAENLFIEFDDLMELLDTSLSRLITDEITEIMLSEKQLINLEELTLLSTDCLVAHQLDVLWEVNEKGFD